MVSKLQASNLIESRLFVDDTYSERLAQTAMGDGYILSQTKLIEEASAKVVTVKVDFLTNTWQSWIENTLNVHARRETPDTRSEKILENS